jgi:hypothetical protein
MPNDEDEHISKIWFEWSRKLREVGQTFISPETEEAFALYLNNSDTNYYSKLVTIEDLDKAFLAFAQSRF